MVLKRWLLLFFIIAFATVETWAQCDRLRSTVSIDFKADQDCAPVEITEFRITYSFSQAQDPASIQIVYEWNDPGNNRTIVNSGNGLVVADGNTSFTANANRLYTENRGQCTLNPTVSLFINGVQCVSSIQRQSAFFWGDDEESNGNMALAPQEWSVCYNNAITNARFTDASEFNCNINVEPDHPNDRERHVQFVYGTNHNPGNTIRSLSLVDGGTRPLTTATGALASSVTRGTGGEQVTGAYFGPIVTIPVPANGPNAVSFPMNAPANAANLVGSRFEVTLFNWNMCNPWNGDPVNPNYEDAVRTRGYIVIVDGPAPVFVAQDSDGNTSSSFCIGEEISFVNQTPNLAGYSYSWRFYDDAAGTQLLATINRRHPTFTFNSGGQKLVRLRATNPTAQGSCVEEYDAIINITPSLAAQIGVTDLAGNPIVPEFCQEPSTPFTDFDVRFTDLSTGITTPTTVRRWEFYDENNNMIFDAPSGANNFGPGILGPFDRVFRNPGVYRVRLRIRDDITDCESSAEVSVRVFSKPQPRFNVNRVCEGSPVTVEDLSTHVALGTEKIVSWEWDMDYNGLTFNKEGSLDNERNFDYTYANAGTYDVALRVTTDGGSCSAMVVRSVTVDPLPVAAFTPDVTSGCSALPVSFTNLSVNGQLSSVKEFVWEIDSGNGFEVDSVQRPGDPGFSDVFVRSFVNTGLADREYRVRLRVVTLSECSSTSASVGITVAPEPRSGFVSLNYSPYNDNCTPVSVQFKVDDQTQALNPTAYMWRVSDANGVIDEQSTGTTPAFTYSFVNNTQVVKDFYVTLRAVLPSSCDGDSTRIIRVAPAPLSGFEVDTLNYSCDKVLLGMTATQKGLAVYDWTVKINDVIVYNSTSDGDYLEYEITRAAAIDQNVVVTLSTTNMANCRSTPTSRSMFIARAGTMNASFTATPAEQTLPESTVTIVNSSSAGPWSYHWDFGDGTTSTSAFVTSHTYETFGDYRITLTLTNHDCVQTVFRDIRINPIPPVLDFEYFPPVGCAPHTVTFVNQSKYADPTSYVWKFGNGQGTSRAIDPTYTYDWPGLYSVTLSATNGAGDTVSITKEFIIQVLESPVAQFAVYPTTPLNVPGEILYTDNRSRNATEYLWNFGDGTTSSDPEPHHKYTSEGTFTVTLTAVNSDGCADTATLASAVTTVNHGQLLIPNAFIPNRGGPGSGDIRNNEIFLPLIQKVRKFQMLIFNRWGELMFESTNPEVGWDGYHQGRLCAQDVYIYRITTEYENGKTITRTGDINLLR